MQNTRIEIKYSIANNAPNSLNIAEPAYSYASNTLFVGTPDNSGAIPIGGKFYVDAINAAFSVANAANGSAIVEAFDQANAAYDAANTVYTYTSNTVLSVANSAYAKANAANINADFANTVAIAAFETANSGAGSAGAYDQANAAYDYANTVYTYTANDVMLVANSAFEAANSITTEIAEAAYDKANSANILAYAALPQSGGTIDGDLAITGNVTISGNTTYANTETLLIGDNIIELNADLPHTVAPTENAGVQVNRGNAGANVSVLWNETADEWQFTNDGTTFSAIPSNTSVEIAQAKGEAAHLTANTTYTYAANDVMLAANTAYAKANAANINATFANTVAIAAFDKANTGTSDGSAFDQANAAYDYANTVYTYAANNVMLVANAAYAAANAASGTAAADAFDKANSANIIAEAAFIQANSSNLIAIAAFEAANSGSGAGAAYDKANAANIVAEAAFIRANVVWDSANSNYTYSANDVMSVANSAFEKANNTNITADFANTVAIAAFDTANLANLIPVGNTTPTGVYTTRATARALNFINGTNVTIEVNEDVTHNAANIIINATAEGGTVADAWNKANSANYFAYLVDQNTTAAFAYANSVYTYAANDVMLVANSAFEAANSGSSAAAAFDKANSANIIAEAAFIRANTVWDSSNTVYTYAANNVMLVANSAYDKANTACTLADAASTAAGSAYDKANTACTSADAASTAAGSAYVKANTTYTYAANTVRLIANSAYAAQNTTYAYAANNVMLVANSAYDKANAANIIAESAFIRANAVWDSSNTTYTYAANNVMLAANTAYDKANTACTSADAASTAAGSAYVKANTTYTYAANDVMSVANSAYGRANVVNVGNSSITVQYQQRGSQKAINFVEGTDIDISVDQDDNLEVINVRISSTATEGASASDAFDKANLAFTIAANQVQLIANSAYGEANVTMNVGITTAGTFTPTSKRRALNFIEGSGITITIDDDAVLNTANVTITSTGGDTTIAEAAFAQANTVWDSSNTVYTYAANDVMRTANAAYAAGNSNYTFTANTVRLIANSAYDAANSTYTYAANNVMLAANSAYAKANAANITADNAQADATQALSDASAASDIASAAYVASNTVYTYAANTVMLVANSAYANANAAIQTWVDTDRLGFRDRTETTLDYNDSTYTFTLQDAGGGWGYYRQGKLWEISGNKQVVLGSPPADGLWYIYIDDNAGTLTASTTEWTLRDDKVPVASVEWRAGATPKYWIADERHSVALDRALHYYIHAVEGAKLISAPSLTGYSVGVDTNAAVTFAISASTILDQDYLHENSSVGDGNGTSPTNYVIWYRTASDAWTWAYSNMPYKYTPGSYIEYDNNGTMTTGATSKYYTTYLLVTSLEGDAAYIIIPGRGEYGSLAEASAEAIENFTWENFEISESVIAYRFIWYTGNSYGSDGRVRLAAEPLRINLSTVTNVSSGSGIGHNSLSGLQGGTTDEFYHLTQAEYEALGLGYDKANTANLIAESAFIQANTVWDSANSNYTYTANDVMSVANSAYAKANTANITADLADIQSQAAFDRANSVWDSANSNYTFTANTVRLIANSAYDKANTNYTYAANNVMGTANSAYAAQNTTYTFAANTVRLIANTAYDKANAANLLAFAALPQSGGTIYGDLIVTGNVTISGNTTFTNTETLLIGDNIIELNSDLPHTIAPSEDAGIKVNRGSSANVFLQWDEGNDVWMWSDDNEVYWKIPSNTQVETAQSKGEAAHETANTTYTYAANNVMLAANSAYDKANTTYTYTANNVMLTANSAYAAQNTTYTFAANTVRLIANSAYAKANTANITADLADAQSQAAFDRANAVWNSANSNYTFAANTVRLIANSSYDKANTACTSADAASTAAGAAYGKANTTYTYAANNVMLAANTAYTHANTIYTYAANTVNMTANMAYANAIFANTVAIAAFEQANTGGGGATVEVSDTAPGSPTANSMWWNSALGKMFIYYNDGSSSQWVESSPGLVSSNTGVSVEETIAIAAFTKANTINVRNTTPLNITVSSVEPTGNTIGDVWIDIS